MQIIKDAIMFLSGPFLSPWPWQWGLPVLTGGLQEEGAHGSDLPTLRQELLSSVSPSIARIPLSKPSTNFGKFQYVSVLFCEI